jgi:hypothetical protein
MFCLNACKKDSQPANSNVTIVGKWFITKQSSELYYNGAEIEAFTDTSFTTNDFAEYYSDGSGYFSMNSTSGPSLTEFTYTLKGTALTQFTGAKNTATPETITNLTTNNLSIHAQSLVPDPSGSGQIDTEIDDYNYKR